MALTNPLIPKGLKWEEDTLSSTYGKFSVEPFEKGSGQTIGNSLRRILLSSLPGAAVTAVKIDKVSHEFSTVSGVKEDVTRIILNLKKLKIKLNQSNRETIFLEGEGEGVVQAGQIRPNPNVEILNPDLVIATLAADGKIKMEITVEKGKGYLPVRKMDVRSLPVGVILVDGIFSPVLKVNYVVETISRGGITDCDKLIMEIWTDGSIHPSAALKEAAQILKDSFKVFVPEEEKIPFSEDKLPERKPSREKQNKLKTLLNQEVNILELSVRSIRCLERIKVKRICDLVVHNEEEFLKYKNFGKKSLEELKKELVKLDPRLHLGMELPKKK